MHHSLQGEEQKGNKAELLARVKSLQSVKVAMATYEANKNSNPSLRSEPLPPLTAFKGKLKVFSALEATYSGIQARKFEMLQGFYRSGTVRYLYSVLAT